MISSTILLAIRASVSLRGHFLDCLRVIFLSALARLLVAWKLPFPEPVPLFPYTLQHILGRLLGYLNARKIRQVSLIFCGSVLYAHSTIGSKLFIFVASVM